MLLKVRRPSVTARGEAKAAPIPSPCVAVRSTSFKRAVSGRSEVGSRTLHLGLSGHRKMRQISVGTSWVEVPCGMVCSPVFRSASIHVIAILFSGSVGAYGKAGSSCSRTSSILISSAPHPPSKPGLASDTRHSSTDGLYASRRDIQRLRGRRKGDARRRHSRHTTAI